MKLVYYKDESVNEPFLVLDETEDSYVLGLREYPDVEQDEYTPKSDVIVIQEGTKEYAIASQIIENLLN